MFDLDLKNMVTRKKADLHISKQMQMSKFQEVLNWLLFYSIQDADAEYKSSLNIEK